MPKLKPGTIWPSPEEEDAITAAAMSDPDAMPYTDEEWEQVKPFLCVGGRPVAAITKERITIRLSRDVVEKFRATGAGWQTRIGAALKDWIANHP